MKSVRLRRVFVVQPLCLFCGSSHNEYNGYMKITRRMFIDGPYIKCPECLAEKVFGIFMQISGDNHYQRECIECGFTRKIELPTLRKKVIYLDQFVLSELLKLLDSEHPSHEKIKKDKFWTDLFIKLEQLSKSQAVIFPDSFYHRDESIAGDKVDFRLMRRLYEHFSAGHTLYPDTVIEKNLLLSSFNSWLIKEDPIFDNSIESIAFEGEKIHNWSLGLGISVTGGIKKEQVSELKKRNQNDEKALISIWKTWSEAKEFDFITAVHNEVGALKQHIRNAFNFHKKQVILNEKISQGKEVDWSLEDIYPPISQEIFLGMFNLGRSVGLSDQDAAASIISFFDDTDFLLKIPKIKISSIMYAGLARNAALGSKKIPKSLVDVKFISSYMPYCDAMFIDKECERLLRQLPKNTPKELRLECFPVQIFSRENKEEFLTYLDSILKELPQDHVNILKELKGENYMEPYWAIIKSEKDKIKNT